MADAYLLDTNIISELSRPMPCTEVVSWMATVPETDLFLSAATIGEIAKGIDRLREKSHARALRLEAWLAAISVAFSDRVLDIDAATARIWGSLMAGRRTPPAMDMWLVATARRHGLVVVTRNICDFKGYGVPLIDPFSSISVIIDEKHLGTVRQI